MGHPFSSNSIPPPPLFMTEIFNKLEHTIRDRFRGAKDFLTGHAPETNVPWHNWAGNQRCTPAKTFHPRTVDDLKGIVKMAKDEGRGIRCVAEGHSWSSISNTNGYLVNVTEMDDVVVQRSDTHGWTVTAGSGATLSKLDETLKAHNPPLTLVSATVLDNVRVGGIVATGSHGATTWSRTIPEQVVSMIIVTADGEEHEFSDEIDLVEMSAARVNLGLLGIIYTVTFRVQPMYHLRMIDFFPPITSWLNAATLKEIVNRSEAVEVFYWPFNSGDLTATHDKLWVKQWVRTEDPVTQSQDFLRAERIGQQLSVSFSDKLYEFLPTHPSATPHLCRLLFEAGLKSADNVLLAPDAIHYQHGIDGIPCWDLEFAFKVNEDFSNVVEGVSMIIDKVYQNAKKNKFPFNLTAEFRLCKSSQAFLSSAYDTDPDAIYCFLEVLAIKGTGGFDTFSAELGDAWMKQFGARPHWAKMWEHVPGVHARLRTQPGNADRFAKFDTVRRKYDPKGMFFGNPSLKAVLLGEKLPSGFNSKAVAGFKR
ncbi:hypothetical protein BC938DRAFT_478872 [Jimgerdemannia flammicorona]|uniref:D-arabinono-1,4-lactone oxidase n=1 Tax=Jimgerdemannia flammicorona TaxID=994334 RepID=A0A433QYB4_9FUNG|nr:hypothetical protein BC938DRAFT_478872 [Jimgerdemannia flammicorona]